jgi:hypothetical protein
VLPLALVHPPQGVKLLAWCAERQDFRQFFVRAMENPTPQPGDFSENRMWLPLAGFRRGGFRKVDSLDSAKESSAPRS